MTDLLLLTAADEEDAAVRQVEDGALGEWRDLDPPDGAPACQLWERRFTTLDGRASLRVVLARPVFQGGTAAANLIGGLMAVLQPRCLAMTGVCAGHPDRTSLGDVVIADRLWRYDQGAWINPTPAGSPNFQPDIWTWQPPADWQLPAKQFHTSFPPDTEWLRTRPIPAELQQLWVLHILYQGQDPLEHPECEVRCPDWTPVVQALQQAAQVQLQGLVLTLTDSGKQHLERILFEHRRKLPEAPPWRVHLGPMGTGTALQKDATIWDRLETQQRHALALEMEGADVGQAAYLHEPGDRRLRVFVAKGVMDRATVAKNDAYRAFAARAAAEVTLRFLREHLRPGGRTLEDLLDSGISTQLPENPSPAALLHTRYRIVPFQWEIRQAEEKLLETWCAGAEGVEARLFTGPGGAGKTRLFLEWTQRLRERGGWAAGFLREEPGEEDRRLLSEGLRPTFLIVDYAESRPWLEGFLREVLARRREGAPLRVALVARHAGDWWQALLGRDGKLGDALRLHTPHNLAEAPVEGEQRRAVFEHARRTFAAIQRVTRPERERDLSDPRFGRVLYLHLAALAEVEQGVDLRAARPSETESSPAETLLDWVVEHEQRFWLDQFRTGLSTDLQQEAFQTGAARLVAAVTLRGGVPDRETAQALRIGVEGPDAAEFLPFLGRLYPGNNPRDRYLGPLEPDLLGETLVLRVLAHRETPTRYLTRVFQGAPESAVEQGLMVLGRIAAGSPASAARAQDGMREVLQDDLAGRAAAAVSATLALGTEQMLPPLGGVLARALEAG
ncbi:MAG: hypothetical protein FJX77_05355, partial [Armatimonadetes bacterium]|nr:hypothetical protein [Armatimonadota bacterium]